MILTSRHLAFGWAELIKSHTIVVYNGSVIALCTDFSISGDDFTCSGEREENQLKIAQLIEGEKNNKVLCVAIYLAREKLLYGLLLLLLLVD